MKENIYKITYKKGTSMIVKALSMILKDGKYIKYAKLPRLTIRYLVFLMQIKFRRSNA